MGYAEQVAAGQARKTNELLEKQIAVSLETNKLLRQMLQRQGVSAAEPAVGSPSGQPAEKSAWRKIADSF